MFEEEVLQTWLDQQHRFADQANLRSAEAFRTAAKNWAEQNDPTSIPEPKAPMAVRAVIMMYPMGVRFEETSTPVSTLDPKTLLRVLPSDVGALGGDVGAPMRDENGQVIPGQWQRSSTCTKWPGQTTTQNGKKFVLIAEGFAGARRYWQEIGK